MSGRGHHLACSSWGWSGFSDLKSPWEEERPVPENQVPTLLSLGLPTGRPKGPLCSPGIWPGQASDSWKSFYDSRIPSCIISVLPVAVGRAWGEAACPSQEVSPRSPKMVSRASLLPISQTAEVGSPVRELEHSSLCREVGILA